MHQLKSLSIFWWNGTPQYACLNAIIKPQMYKEISGRIKLNRIKKIPSERWTIVRGINKRKRWASKSHCFSNCNQQVLLLNNQNASYLHLPRFGSLRCGPSTFSINIATIMVFFYELYNFNLVVEQTGQQGWHLRSWPCSPICPPKQAHWGINIPY